MINIETSIVTLPFNLPVPVRGRTLTENRYLKVSLLSEDVFLSVLPGMHESTLEEVRFKLLHFFSHYTPDLSNVDFSQRFFNTVSHDEFLNSINNEILYHIECLLLLIIRKSLPEKMKWEEIKTNDLYSPETDAVFYKNTSCLKIKITPGSAQNISSLINELHTINPSLLIRLDGNRQFELNELIEFENYLKKNISRESFKNIDYIEEPFKNFYDTYVFMKRSELTLAVDESFTLHPEFSNEHPLVIKPSLFGISSIYNWMLKHSKNRIIISSSFEHSSVRIGLVFLAGLRPLEFHGLPSRI